MQISAAGYGFSLDPNPANLDSDPQSELSEWIGDCFVYLNFQRRSALKIKRPTKKTTRKENNDIFYQKNAYQAHFLKNLTKEKIYFTRVLPKKI